MAPRRPTPAPQNTEGENGPAQAADTPVPAVDPEGTSGEATAPAEDGEVTQVAPLSSAAGGAGGDGGRVERAMANVISPIDHDGQSYKVDDPIALTREEFTALVKAGAVQDEDWDELPLPF